MKKLFIALTAALLSVCAQAQVVSVAPSGVKLESNTVIAPVAKKAPAKVELKNKQRIVGLSATDEVGYQIGLSNFPGNVKAAVVLPTEIINKYAGSKVVAIRYAIACKGVVSRVFLAPVVGDNTYGADLISQPVSSDVEGWNTIDIPETQQYVLTQGTALQLGFDYTQVANGDENKLYPLFTAPNNYAAGSYAYINLPESLQGHGLDWYDLGNRYGSLCIQLIVENDNFLVNAVKPTDFGTFTTTLNNTAKLPVVLENLGTKIESITYTMTIGETTGEEQTFVLPEPFTIPDNTVEVEVPVNVPSTTGKYAAKMNITKVNGNTNEAEDKEAVGEMQVVYKILSRRIVMEENTGTSCGWCPRGIAAMEKLNEQYPDKFIGIAIHRYNRTDPMYNTNYANIPIFNGAPRCIMNRTHSIDPYYGTGSGIVRDVEDALTTLPTIGVEVKGYWNTDITGVDASVTVESLVNGQYEVAYALVADGLTGTTNNWQQANFYSSSYSSQTGITSENMLPEDLKKYFNTPSPYRSEFNDVMISSSYNGTVNNAVIGEFKENETTTANYTLPLPTNTVLKNALNYDKIYVVAMIINTETGIIENAAKAQVVFNPTGISTLESTNAGEEVARYNMSGQRGSKGINIIKMSNGKTVKQLVR